MKLSRALFLLVLFVLAAILAWFVVQQRNRSAIGEQITVYYTKIDGTTEVPWPITMRPQAPGESASEHLHNAALYAAVQAVAGPSSTIDAIRFPTGTQVRSVVVDGTTAVVDLSAAVGSAVGGSLGESGEFKSLVWTLTGLPGINAVAIRIDGQRVDALPGGHLALDEPLRRSDW
ncbi:MAG: GerMN domain-containing protein [Candidatus Eremiobacteraeota bacterium]|nr:GerMN domain-containing protein [Candidatus Eremiobacteraeota bacterium]